MARLGTTCQYATYVCGVAVMRLLRSSLRRDATRVHIMFTDLRQRRHQASWTLLVVIIPFNHHPGLCSVTCTRARPFGVRGHIILLTLASGVPLLRWHGVLAGVPLKGKLDVLPTSCRLSVGSVGCPTACPAFFSSWRRVLDKCVSFGLLSQEASKSF